jgi:hypothetical protein
MERRRWLVFLLFAISLNSDLSSDMLVTKRTDPQLSREDDWPEEQLRVPMSNLKLQTPGDRGLMVPQITTTAGQPWTYRGAQQQAIWGGPSPGTANGLRSAWHNSGQQGRREYTGRFAD